MKLARTLRKVVLISASLLFLFSCENKEDEPSQYVIEGVTLNISQAELIPGESVVLTAFLQPYDKTVDEAISWSDDLKDRIFWKTDNAVVAEVDKDKGIVVAKGVGSCNVSFVCGTKSAKCRIIVRSFDKEIPYGLWNVEGTDDKYYFTFENTGYHFTPDDTCFFDWTFDGMRLTVTNKGSEAGQIDEQLIITTIKEGKIKFYYSDDKDRNTHNLKRVPMEFTYDNLMFAATEKPGLGDSLITVVDMGLPSGTMWAACNLGAAGLNEDGTRYAWAETTTRQSYLLENYKWYDQTPGRLCMTKYVDDNDIQLLDEDDPVSVCLGEEWHTPTKADVQELFDTCHFIYATYLGKEGFVFIPKNEDYGDSRLFLPFSLSSEYVDASSLSLRKYGFYWTSSRSEADSFEAYCLCINVNDDNAKLYSATGTTKRFYALCIRPVYVEKK